LSRTFSGWCRRWPPPLPFSGPADHSSLEARRRPDSESEKLRSFSNRLPGRLVRVSSAEIVAGKISYQHGISFHELPSSPLNKCPFFELAFLGRCNSSPHVVAPELLPGFRKLAGLLWLRFVFAFRKTLFCDLRCRPLTRHFPFEHRVSLLKGVEHP